MIQVTRGLKAFLILSGKALFVVWLPDIIPTLQVVSGAIIPIPVLATKSLSFVAFGVFALFFHIKMYKELSDESAKEK